MALNSHRWSELKRGLASKVRVSEVGKPRNLARFGRCLLNITGTLGHISIYILYAFFGCVLLMFQYISLVNVRAVPGSILHVDFGWLKNRDFLLKSVCDFFQSNFTYFVIQRGCFCLTEC